MKSLAKFLHLKGHLVRSGTMAVATTTTTATTTIASSASEYKSTSELPESSYGSTSVNETRSSYATISKASSKRTAMYSHYGVYEEVEVNDSDIPTKTSLKSNDNQEVCL